MKRTKNKKQKTKEKLKYLQGVNLIFSSEVLFQRLAIHWKVFGCPSKLCNLKELGPNFS
jgi:hypothetical protein